MTTAPTPSLEQLQVELQADCQAALAPFLERETTVELLGEIQLALRDAVSRFQQRYGDRLLNLCELSQLQEISSSLAAMLLCADPQLHADEPNPEFIAAGLRAARGK